MLNRCILPTFYTLYKRHSTQNRCIERRICDACTRVKGGNIRIQFTIHFNTRQRIIVTVSVRGVIWQGFFHLYGLNKLGIQGLLQ